MRYYERGQPAASSVFTCLVRNFTVLVPSQCSHKSILHSVNVHGGTVAPLFLLTVLNNKDTKAEWSVVVSSRVSRNSGE